MTALTHAILRGLARLAEPHNSCDIPAGFLLDITAKQEVAGSVSKQGEKTTWKTSLK